jgi:2-phosphosulfolactate phosphatase
MKQTKIEVLFAPAEFDALKERDLGETVCVVFDVLRATSSMMTALGNGAVAIIPVMDIPEALSLRTREAGVLLAGERDGLRIEANLTRSIAFDLGNSPREFSKEKVNGRTIAMTTTNGTRALRACIPAKRVLIGSFLNLRATANFIEKENVADLLLVCSGTFDQVAYEDILGAGALCELLWSSYQSGAVADSAQIARRLFQLEQEDLFAAVAQSRNGRRLLTHKDLQEDVAFCVRRDVLELVAELGKDGLVRTRKVSNANKKGRPLGGLV